MPSQALHSFYQSTRSCLKHDHPPLLPLEDTPIRSGIGQICHHIPHFYSTCVGSHCFPEALSSVQTHPHDQFPVVLEPHANTYGLLSSTIEAGRRSAPTLQCRLHSHLASWFNSLKNIRHEGVARTSIWDTSRIVKETWCHSNPIPGSCYLLSHIGIHIQVIHPQQKTNLIQDENAIIFPYEI